jgi:alpha-L-fucosidase
LATRKGNTLYIVLHRPPSTRRVLLKPIAVAPARATLLNTGAAVETSLEDLPTLHMGPGGLLVPEPQRYLRLRNLPVDALAGTVPVIKLAFETWPLP